MSLNFAVVTGCLRISKESIFTGLNNLKVVTMLDDSYAESFGFVQSEVDEMLDFYGIAKRKEELREWYDGYLFGETEVYNPWSVLNYVFDILERNTEFPKPYWSNTSSNSIVKELIENADIETKDEIEKLIEGGSIEKPVHEDITYSDVYLSQDNLWNFLFFTGYLKMVTKRFVNRVMYISVRIPNQEILYLYENQVRDWMYKRTRAADFTELYEAVKSGNTKVFEDIMNKQLRETISIMDSSENFYHGFLLGLLGAMPGYRKISNRESGEGRYDIVLEPYDMMDSVIILEIKRAVRFQDMEKKCHEALKQIDEKHYDAEFVYVGYPVIKKYGICFCRKNCMMRI